MSTEHPKAYYTAVFLQVSFKAIKHSMAGKVSDGLPCWLDGKMLAMLGRELKECRDQAADNNAAHQALSRASLECERLLSHCPGGLDTSLCHRHLDAILTALQCAVPALAGPPAAPATSLWQSAREHLREGWKRLT
ncbi:hypothetical protein [Halomonas sp. BM-2019]|uniref:hypothetical protein n=1 Tax=Halomonas sp. BM-2019 TaxID=2811227 RepID=UPI001B3C1A68|nr:MAG: hypothetical protein J5F18_13730 [Halomonas sp. BM-2019]